MMHIPLPGGRDTQPDFGMHIQCMPQIQKAKFCKRSKKELYFLQKCHNFLYHVLPGFKILCLPEKESQRSTPKAKMGVISMRHILTLVFINGLSAKKATNKMVYRYIYK